jgi:Sulfotransferase family
MNLEEIADPLIVLAPERSNGTLLLAMLGQHTDLCSFMETRLFTRPEMGDWISDFWETNAAHGLLRTTAEVVFGRQTEKAIEGAQQWLLFRANRSTIDVFSELAAVVHPLRVVERTPAVTYRRDHMCRIRRHFPEAQYIHLVTHPCQYRDKLMDDFRERFRKSPDGIHKLLETSESIFFDFIDMTSGVPRPDPFRAWRRRHTSILKFLSNIAGERQLRIRAEDLVQAPHSTLDTVLDWLGLCRDEAVLENMRHPDGWQFASVGPRSAQGGADDRFLSNPVLPRRKEEDALFVHGADEISELDSETRELAGLFGYI